jgi:hypothetical protein
LVPLKKEAMKPHRKNSNPNLKMVCENLSAEFTLKITGRSTGTANGKFFFMLTGTGKYLHVASLYKIEKVLHATFFSADPYRYRYVHAAEKNGWSHTYVRLRLKINSK